MIKQMIILDINDMDFDILKSHADACDTTVKRLLQQFINDLVANDESGGSDERHLAQSWFQRSKYNF